MAFTEAQVKQSRGKAQCQAYQNPPGQRHHPRLCRGLACHRRGKSYLRLRRLGQANAQPTIASGPEPKASSITPPIPPRYVSVCAPVTSPSCGRAQALERARRSLLGKLMSWRSKRPKPTPPSGRLPPSAIPSALRSMTGSRWVSAKHASGKQGRDDLAAGPWVLHSATGASGESFAKPSEFADALRKIMAEAQDIELLFAIWERNVETVRALNRSLKQEVFTSVGDCSAARGASETMRHRSG